MPADGSALAVQAEGFTIGVRRQDIKDSAEEDAMLNVLSKMTGQKPSKDQSPICGSTCRLVRANRKP